jgi:hypothetical protein
LFVERKKKMGTMMGGDCPKPKKRLSFGDYLVAAIFMIGVLLCSRYMWAIVRGEDVANMSLYISTICIAGIVLWIIFIIIGWTKYIEGRVRFLWVLIAATALTGADLVAFMNEYRVISLGLAMFIFLLIAFYDFFAKREWWAE